MYRLKLSHFLTNIPPTSVQVISQVMGGDALITTDQDSSIVSGLRSDMAGKKEMHGC